jgi:hypothetical protein
MNKIEKRNKLPLEIEALTILASKSTIEFPTKQQAAQRKPVTKPYLELLPKVEKASSRTYRDQIR